MAVATLAGFIDSIAGGGGLLTVPALLLSGMNPLVALGTNKLQSTFGSATATWRYAKGGWLEPRKHGLAVATTFAGAVLGVWVVQSLPLGGLKLLLPIFLVGIGIYFLVVKTPQTEGQNAKITEKTFSLTAAPSIGFYDGLFGPGTGSFFMVAFVSLRALPLLVATARTKLLNMTSNVAALCAFAVAGHMDVKVGVAMGAGQLMGAWVGSQTAMRWGASIIKPLLVTVCFALTLRVAMDTQNPWRVLFQSLWTSVLSSFH